MDCWPGGPCAFVWGPLWFRGRVVVVLFWVGQNPLFVRVSRIGSGVALIKRDQPAGVVALGSRIRDGFRLRAVAVHGVGDFRLAFALASSLGGPQSEVGRVDFEEGSNGELEVEVGVSKVDGEIVVGFSKLK